MRTIIKFLKKIYSRVVSMKFAWRIAWLNLNENIIVDKTCTIHTRAFIKIWKGGSIKIGPYTEIMPGVMFLTYGGSIEVGKNCSINPYSIICGHGGVKIGNNVLIAPATMIIPNNHVFVDASTPIIFQGNQSKGINIEDDVWIGHGCSILDGVTIGKGSVVAAGSVVNANIEPYSVVGGVPAKIIRKRN